MLQSLSWQERANVINTLASLLESRCADIIAANEVDEEVHQILSIERASRQIDPDPKRIVGWSPAPPDGELCVGLTEDPLVEFEDQ